MASAGWTARLYRGDISYDFVGHSKRWYTVSAVLLGISIVALAVFRINPGIEFKGGSEFTIPKSGVTIAAARDVVGTTLPGSDPIVTKVGASVRIQTKALSQAQTTKVEEALSKRFGVTIDNLNPRSVGPSWGSEITKKAVTGLIVFLVLVVLFLSAIFEWRLAVAAMAALAHDLIITVGVYALSRFEVTPATVIGFLTILGYSLYDTVVVFDKVRENSRGLTSSTRMTYSEAANLAVNQTLVRSINTSLVALLPVLSILVVGGLTFGAGTLEDLSLALFIGIAIGTYSSIFIATPIAATLKEREPAMASLRARVLARRSGTPAPAPRARAAASAAAAPRPALAAEDTMAEPAAGYTLATPNGDAPAAASGASRATPPRRPQQRKSGPRNRPSGKRKK